jgi:CO dehydrogenase maturation factor
VQHQDDVAYLRENVGDDLIGWLGQSDWVRRAEQGRRPALTELEPENRATLRLLHSEVDASHARRDWARYTEQMVRFHLRNAESWGNAKTGVDLAAQVDPDFVLGEGALGEGVPGQEAAAGAALPV